MSESTTNDGSGVEHVVFSYFAAFGAADLDSILDHYADDAVFMPAGLPTVTGKDNLREAYIRTLAEIRILPGGESVAEDVLVLGDLAWVRTTSQATAANPQTGAQVRGQFREVFLLRRTAGNWKIWRYMFNTISAAGDQSAN